VDIDDIQSVNAKWPGWKLVEVANAPEVAVQDDFSAPAQNPLGNFALGRIVGDRYFRRPCRLEEWDVIRTDTKIKQGSGANHSRQPSHLSPLHPRLEIVKSIKPALRG
jgi:hypothetical protein